MIAKDYVVFTSLFGDYESLNELEIQKNQSTRYVCFTDNPKLQSSTWEVCLVELSGIVDPARASREVKMLGYKNFPVSTPTLYVDNSVKLKVDGSLVIETWLKTGDVAFMHHYQRKTVRNEFFVCSAYGLDDQRIIWKQFRYYRQNFKSVLNQKPYWGGMIARINSVQTEKLMLEWKRQYDSFSKRDQLSINVSSLISGVAINRIIASNALSEWHEWPIKSNRKESLRQQKKWKRFGKLQVILNAFAYGGRYFYPAIKNENSSKAGDNFGK